MKLALGTVQFGLDYGVTNHGGRTDADEAARILDSARAAGIDLLDTASLYGCSEQVLGECGVAAHGWRVVTKTLQFKGEGVGPAQVHLFADALEASFAKLGTQRLYAVLVHHAPDLLAAGGALLYARLQQLKQEGRIAKIGFSAYDGATIEQVLARYPVDLVQLPMNVLDQRLPASGALERLQRHGVEVHVRSAFLQGLLVGPADALPPHLEPLAARLARFGEVAAQAGMSRAGLALAYLRQMPQVSQIVLGVNSEAQLQQCVRAYHEPQPQGVDFSLFRCDDSALVDPSRWPPKAP
jgi:aryl-alcohol dehydrogenase-like predicted oxidoreductase